MGMKRSQRVRLVILGTLGATAVAGCSPEYPLQQARYASLEDCRRDWGYDYRNCQNGDGSAGGGGRYVYYGPRYYWDRERGYPVAVDADGSRRAVPYANVANGTPRNAVGMKSAGIVRGGFGGSAHASSGG